MHCLVRLFTRYLDLLRGHAGISKDLWGECQALAMVRNKQTKGVWDRGVSLCPSIHLVMRPSVRKKDRKTILAPQMRFDYAEKTPPCSYASSLAGAMQVTSLVSVLKTAFS